MDKKRCTAIVLAAGKGSRMKSDIAKQYLDLCGKPLIWYALHAIEESSVIDDCILVTTAEDISYVKEEIVMKYGFSKVGAVVAGGEQRYDSVYRALRVIAGDGAARLGNMDGYVFIHDGARPFLTEEILKRCYDRVCACRACAVGMPVKDTIKLVDADGFAVQTPDRSMLWQVQTPQVFDASLIVEAYEKMMAQKNRTDAEKIRVTDDAMVVETFMDVPVGLVQGSYENIKVTTPEDMAVAEMFVHKNASEF